MRRWTCHVIEQQQLPVCSHYHWLSQQMRQCISDMYRLHFEISVRCCAVLLQPSTVKIVAVCLLLAHYGVHDHEDDCCDRPAEKQAVLHP